jgi:hypothetical protein
MINRKTLIGLAAVTLVLFLVAGMIGEDNDVLWIVDDVVYFGFIGCLIALVALSIAVVVRSFSRQRTK